MEQPDTCVVCEEPFVLGGWGIPHGQGICGHCGAVYMLAGDDAPTCTLDDDGKRIAREYYEETGEPAVFVQNDGVTREQAEQFNEWYERTQE